MACVATESPDQLEELEPELLLSRGTHACSQLENLFWDVAKAISFTKAEVPEVEAEMMCGSLLVGYPFVQALSKTWGQPYLWCTRTGRKYWLSELELLLSHCSSPTEEPRVQGQMPDQSADSSNIPDFGQ